MAKGHSDMVSYYNPSVAMFSRTGSGHHYHHPSPTQNPYFNPAAAAAYGNYHAHTHGLPHQQGSGGSPVGVGVGAGIGVGPGGLTGVGSVGSPQFSSNMASEFNCNHPQYHPHQFSNMTTDPMASASWHQNNVYTSACAAARNAAALGVPPHPSPYDDWPPSTHSVVSSGHHPHVHPHHAAASFYHHSQPSPPSSTPSPNSSHPGGSQSPRNHVYSSSATPNNNNNNNNNSSNSNIQQTFKTEFDPCSSGNPQENSSQEMSGQVVGSSGGPSIPTPHSPDSGMAISDGVSSSGSPATGQQYQNNNCLGGPSINGSGSNNTNQTSAPLGPNDTNNNNNNSNNLHGAQHPMHLHGSHLHHHHHHLNQGTNLNMSAVTHQNQLINSEGRPTQARSPFEWLKKPAAYSAGSNSSNNAKTRTKDKYRVVYTDMQRLELEKEFHYSRYITIRRKSELASALQLSERQVKIWFQNRRAKERKVVRKREEVLSRDKMAHMAHLQNMTGMVGMPGSPMLNQSNGLSIIYAHGGWLNGLKSPSKGAQY